MKQLPTLFVSHGAPDLLLGPSPARDFLLELGRGLERPRFVLVASAHWLTAAPQVDASPAPATIHDFSGFGRVLAEYEYGAPGAPDAARRVVELLRAGGFEAETRERGRDHGAWVPLALLWPAADVPAFQISIQPDLDARHHHELGRALAPLRDEGALILASGSATHDLAAIGPPLEIESQAFEDWLVRHAEAGDVDELLDWKARAPFAEHAHPTDDHLLPLFVALGAAGPGAKARVLHRSLAGSLHMTAFSFSP